MINLKKELLKRREYLEKLLSDHRDNIINIPGTLRITHKKGVPYYYHRERKTDRSGKYINKKNLQLAKELAQKDYDQRMICTITDELTAIDTFIRLNPDIPPEDIYLSLSPERRNLVESMIETDDMFAEKWISAPYQGKLVAGDVPFLLTDRGERVRSKSEVIIANLLAKEGIPYKYECPLTLKRIGTIHPDFTVLDKHDRKEMYWEHQGMMDNPEYVEKAISRTRNYIYSGIYPGERLIITSETKNQPLNTREIKTIIEHYFLRT